MPPIKNESHQKKKPTRNPKRKRSVVGGNDVHLITDQTNEESILIAGQNDEDNIINIFSSPDRSDIAAPTRLFDDAASPLLLSPSPITDVQTVNNRYTKFKSSANKKVSPVLDDKCVLTLLRSSYVRTSIGELKSGTRKPTHYRNTRRPAINEFGISMYSKKKTIDPSGNRRSTRHLPSNEATNTTIDMCML